ncbi:MAG: type II toxin-antitoxin system HicA family toxin [Proteobacteria bacterium]|nr:type II toxin-antitoxin system HicA family toxin [Pseudomonadota bacterium]
MPKRPYTIRELLKKLKTYGIVIIPSKRGKGSEVILLKPNKPGSKQGPQIPIKNHGPSTEIHYPVIMSILRRFGINPKDFWDD